jgi:hypothetical protein
MMSRFPSGNKLKKTSERKLLEKYKTPIVFADVEKNQMLSASKTLIASRVISA